MKKRNHKNEIFKSSLLTRELLKYHAYWCSLAMLTVILLGFVGISTGKAIFDSFSIMSLLKWSSFLLPVAFVMDCLLITFLAPNDRVNLIEELDGLYLDVWVNRKLVSQVKIKSIDYWVSDSKGHTHSLEQHGTVFTPDWNRAYSSTTCCVIIEDTSGRKIQLFEELKFNNAPVDWNESSTKMSSDYNTYPVNNLALWVETIEHYLSNKVLSTLDLNEGMKRQVLKLEALQTLKATR